MSPVPAIDLNADLGEGSPHDAELLGLVSSATGAAGVEPLVTSWAAWDSRLAAASTTPRPAASQAIGPACGPTVAQPRFTPNSSSARLISETIR